MNVSFVDWEALHAQRLIRVTVRLDIWPRQKDAWLKNWFNKEKIDALEQRWKGKFKCYDFQLKLDVKYVSSLDKVRPDALDVRLDDEMFEAGNTVSHGPIDPKTGKSKPPPDVCMSDDPKDQVIPGRAPEDESRDKTTSWPPSINTIAHELGHVLGLDEGYTLPAEPGWFESAYQSMFGDESDKPKKGPQPILGHPKDIMQSPAYPVLPSTITRLVRRQFGRSLEEQMHCPIGLRSGPSDFNLLLASITDIRLDVKAERYDPPTDDPAAPPDPTKFKGTFHAAGEYLAKLKIPGISASGTLDRQVDFDIDLGKKPIQLRIDLGFWALKQTLGWSEHSGLPYAAGPLQIESDGSTLDSSVFWPGPPLLADFYDPDHPGPAA